MSDKEAAVTIMAQGTKMGLWEAGWSGTEGIKNDFLSYVSQKIKAYRKDLKMQAKQERVIQD